MAAHAYSIHQFRTARFVAGGDWYEDSDYPILASFLGHILQDRSTLSHFSPQLMFSIHQAFTSVKRSCLTFKVPQYCFAIL